MFEDILGEYWHIGGETAANREWLSIFHALHCLPFIITIILTRIMMKMTTMSMMSMMSMVSMMSWWVWWWSHLRMSVCRFCWVWKLTVSVSANRLLSRYQRTWSWWWWWWWWRRRWWWWRSWWRQLCLSWAISCCTVSQNHYTFSGEKRRLRWIFTFSAILAIIWWKSSHTFRRCIF